MTHVGRYFPMAEGSSLIQAFPYSAPAEDLRLRKP